MIIAIVVIISLVFSAFFSGMEIAFISSNRVYLEIERSKEGRKAKMLKTVTKNTSEFMTTMLIGNSLSLVVFGYFMSKIIIQFFFPEYTNFQTPPYYVTIWQIAISTLIIFTLAEFLPKVFFQYYAHFFLRNFVGLTFTFYILFFPLTKLIVWFSEKMFKLSSKAKNDVNTNTVFMKSDVDYYIKEEIEKEDRKNMEVEIDIFQNALGFYNIKVREVMVPRAEIVAVEINSTIENLKDLFVKTGRSKILVYEDNIDNIIGYVHTFSLFEKMNNLQDSILPIDFCGETELAKDVLNKLTKERKSIALVFDEYGGTSGVITVEDIVEELFGEIHDEYDKQLLLEKKINDSTFCFSARLEVDFLNKKYYLELPESPSYETLGGLIINIYGDIPKDKDTIIFKDRIKFTVLKVLNTRIDTVQVEILEPND